MTSFEDRARAEGDRRWPHPKGSSEHVQHALARYRIGFRKGALWAREQGCCMSCDGTGAANDPETNGRCWDCRGTGHPHEQEPTDAQVERLCEVMHNAYEDAAVKEGWSTQEASRKPWSDVPEANKRTMRIAVRAVLLAAKEASE